MEERKGLFFLGKIKVSRIWPRSYYLEFTTFSGSMFCSGEELLNWLNKSAKLRGGFKTTELFLLDISM